MENNIDNTNTDKLLEMAQRYFDASLSKSEEQQLFSAAMCSTDPRLDELKAVMAFAACGNAQRRRQRSGRHVSWRYGVAACFAILVATVAISLAAGDAEMVAYVGGTQVTDHEQVMQQMLSAMRSVDINQTDTDVNQELQMMINTIK